jgi:hypothetical protein
MAIRRRLFYRNFELRFIDNDEFGTLVPTSNVHNINLHISV